LPTCSLADSQTAVEQIMVSAGDYHTALLRSDGKVCIAGDDDVQGEYNLTSLNKGRYKQLSAGGSHTLMLSRSGNIATIGLNEHGQCVFPNPRGMHEQFEYVQVSAGHKHSVALRNDGEVVYAGLSHRSSRALDVEANNQPEVVSSPALRCVQVSAGHSHTALLFEDGTASAEGCNLRGQCDLPLSEEAYCQVAAGGAHTVLLHSSGQAVAVGSNQYGQCEIPFSSQYSRVSAGARHTVLLRTDGNVDAVGENADGQCDIPELEPGVAYVQASAGGHHTVLLRSDGQSFTIGHQGATAIPEVHEHQSWRSWFMTGAVLPEGVRYVPDTQEVSVHRFSVAAMGSKALADWSSKLE